MCEFSIGLPKNNDKRDIKITPRIKNCTLIVALVENKAKVPSSNVVIMPTSLIFKEGKIATILSENPIMYKATEKACARYKGMPTAPPISTPNDLLII